MHVCPDAQLVDPPTPQATALPQLSVTLLHSLDPQAVRVPSGTHASLGATSAGASIPALSIVVASSALLPVSDALPVSAPGATSAPGPSSAASAPTVESADPSAGYGLPSSMPSNDPQPPTAGAHANTRTRPSDTRPEAKPYPRFIS
jgi:hypothetical protein